MEEGINETKTEGLEGKVGAALQPPSNRLPSTDFVKVEKNLASLGFFTPSSKRTKNERAKTVSVTVIIVGKRVEAKATIAPTALFGLPITADQDKWLALHKIVSDVQARDGQVTNPVSFSSAELLALLKIYKDSGKNYRDVSDWLDVMVGTTIVSEGAVYYEGKRVFGKDTFHVFDRAVSFGKQLPDGTIADKNYVWLSEWQLKNINDHHQLPIDLDTYRQLKNRIAKALVPLLQVWLYATREDGVFEKRYDELCQILDIRQWSYVSKIREKLGPSLDELKQFGYLADWQVETTSDRTGYKVLFFHGEKFHRDRRARLSRKLTLTGEGTQLAAEIRGANETPLRVQKRPASLPHLMKPATEHRVFDPELVAEFTRRGISDKKAYDLLANLKPNQDRNLIGQLEYADETVRQLQNTEHPVRDPAGFIISFIERNPTLPDTFETSVQRKARLEHERREAAERDAQEARQFLEDEYERYCFAETDRYIAEHPDIFEAIKAAKLAEEKPFSSNTWYGRRDNIALASAKWEIRKQLSVLTFDEFLERKKQGNQFSSEPGAASPSGISEFGLPPVGEGNTGAEEAPKDLLAAEERREAQLAVAMESGEQPRIELAKAEEPAIQAAPETPVLGAELMAPNAAAASAENQPMMLHEVEPKDAAIRSDTLEHELEDTPEEQAAA